MTEEDYMHLAYQQAQKAQKNKEVPVGAVITKNGKVIASAFNKREKKQNALYHAEILAIDKACKKLKSFRLDECDLYVTLEPCPMCCGAIINARIKKLVFGAYDVNYGCAGSHYDFANDKNFNHHPQVVGGVLQEQCSKIIKDFFISIRN